MAVWNDFHWTFWDPRKEPLPENPKQFRKISICTTCMDRTHDLKVTLPKNIEDNKDYPNLEFVVLNYNSKDDLDDWMKSEMMPHIESGLIRYIKTTEPEFYLMSHSRNIAFRAATGEIVNSVDADNYTKVGFAATINKLAELCPEKAMFARSKRMLHGRIGMYKSDFIFIGGYEESLKSYGYDDHNILYRSMALGCKLMWWSGAGDFYDRIHTGKSDSVKNMEHKDWKKTERINKDITHEQLKKREFIGNIGKPWGKAHLLVNFREEIDV